MVYCNRIIKELNKMPDLLKSLIFPIAMFAILYFFLIRPQKKQEAEKKEMISNIKVGDKVITIGGIHGKVVVAKEDVVTIETSSANTKIEISRWAIGSLKN